MRAVAVLGVIAYHLGYRWARGGFLGVDLFFVLSGYLITSLLLDERLSSGTTDFFTFWMHRARRLIPALLLLLVAMAIATRLLLPATDWPFREADLFFALFYAANWHEIASQQDYFAQFVGASAMRHLWSLAIEEQFYLLWPLVLALLVRGRILKARVIVVITAGALLSSIVMFVLFSQVSQSRAYYGTDSRAHELLIGALLAVALRWSPSITRSRPRVGAVVGPAAVLVVLAAFVLLPDSSSFYYAGGSTAFAAAVAFLLWAVDRHPQQLLARLLAHPVPRWIGQLSYGLYLWHWPAIVLGPRLVQQLLGSSAHVILDSSLRLNAFRIGSTFLIATASFYLVERPIRRRGPRRIVTDLRVAMALPAAAVVMSLLFVFVGAIPASDVALVQRLDDCPGNDFICLVSHPGPSGSPVVVLMGDSVAKSLDPALAKIAQEKRWTYLMAARNGCSLIQRWVASNTGGNTRRPGWEGCYNVLPEVYKSVIAQRPRLIVAYDRWLLASSLDDAGHLLYPGSPQHLADTEQRLDRFVQEISVGGSRIALIHILPIGEPVECENAQYASAAECQQKASSDTLTPKYNAVIDRVAATYPGIVSVVDLQDVVCPADRCPPRVDGVWVRSDGLHFTVPGAQWVASALGDRLPGLGAA